MACVSLYYLIHPDILVDAEAYIAFKLASSLPVCITVSSIAMFYDDSNYGTMYLALSSAYSMLYRCITKKDREFEALKSDYFGKEHHWSYHWLSPTVTVCDNSVTDVLSKG
ncbi:hypothetical protein BDZ97DRAFT_1773932 [Flammula alnicola]|nr:hypothetical protein BDZ97DRAFT_1773932 [Flammula alnicola]